MNKEQLKEEARKEFEEAFEHKDFIDFIDSLFTKAYEEGKKEAFESLLVPNDYLLRGGDINNLVKIKAREHGIKL